MLRYQTVLFDLDGTLTDPGIGITNSVAYALEKMGYEVPEREALYRFIGPPLYETFMDYCGIDRAEAERAVALYREYFSVKGLFENRVYDGIPSLLNKLNQKGMHLAVATSKPTVYAIRILERFGLLPFFEQVVGSELDGTRIQKGEVVAHCLEMCEASPASSVMIGDRKHDILGGKENRLYTVGVLWGYGDRAELTAAGADALAPTPASLLDLLA